MYFDDIQMNDNKIKNIAPAENVSDAVNLRQVIDIYHPYIYELNNFQLYNGYNIKINPVNVTIRRVLPPDNLIMKHNHHLVYISSFVPNLIYSQPSFCIITFHSFRNINVKAGNYTFIMEMITEVYLQPYNYNKHNIFLEQITTNGGINLTKYNHKYVDNAYNKVVLQFTSNGTNNGRINFAIRKNNSHGVDKILFFIK